MKDKRDAIDFANEPVGHIFRQLLLPTVIGMLSIVILNLTDGAFIGHGTETKAANINATQAFIGCLSITVLCCALILSNLAGTCRLFGSSSRMTAGRRG